MYYEGARYPRQLFAQVWEVKPRRGKQRRMWGKEYMRYSRGYC